ncbi:MAG: serine hydrolase domain-containing protein [Bacteroidota bacterium]
MKKILIQILFICIGVVLFSHYAAAQTKQKTTKKEYLFFLHNRFVELFDLKTESPEYGRAEYKEILDSFKRDGFIVFSEKRPADTDAKIYAQKVVTQIKGLLQSGVKPNHITIIGISKGGYIAQYVSTFLANPDVNFVFIGSFQERDLTDNPDISFCGNILSIYEATDPYGVSAIKRKETSKLTVNHFSEIELHTNLRHGFLYKALPEWIEPCKKWAKRNYDLHSNKTIAPKIDALLAEKTTKPFNGVILITQNDETIYTKTIGYADIENKTLLQPNDQFCIGSISKQFTAVLVLQQFEKGNIALHTPIKKYLPQLTQSWADTVTIHHLLTHTNGIIALDKPTLFPAGSQYDYSQLGFKLLADIIEQTSGKSFEQLSMELFKTCGMVNTFHPDSKQHHMVKGYTEQANGSVLYDSTSLLNYPAAGGFISTAHDLIIWNKHLHNGKLLKDSTYEIMITKQKNAIRQHPLFGKTEYGYGITVSNENNIIQLGQTGFAPGFNSMNFYYPQTKTTIIVLKNIVNDNGDLRKVFHYHTGILNIVKEDLYENSRGTNKTNRRKH